MNPSSIIYALKHNATGKVYIGRTAHPYERMQAHLSKLRRGVHPVEDMQRDYDLHGKDFTFTIIDDVRNGGLGAEVKWMAKYKSCDRRFGYNYKDPTTKTRRGMPRGKTRNT